jgi:23S rRNA G2445 N2-methylase RlmL
VCGALTEKSLHRRNIVEFSYMTLRATLCYHLLRLARPEPSDIIIDPLCGVASISIEVKTFLDQHYI